MIGLGWTSTHTVTVVKSMVPVYVQDRHVQDGAISTGESCATWSANGYCTLPFFRADVIHRPVCKCRIFWSLCSLSNLDFFYQRVSVCLLFLLRTIHIQTHFSKVYTFYLEMNELLSSQPQKFPLEWKSCLYKNIRKKGGPLRYVTISKYSLCLQKITFWKICSFLYVFIFLNKKQIRKYVTFKQHSPLNAQAFCTTILSLSKPLLKFWSNLFIHKCDHSCKIFNQNPTRGHDVTKLDWGPRRCCLRSNLKLCQPNKDSWHDINVCILIWHAQRPSTVLIKQNSSQNVFFQVIMKPSNF